MSESKSRVNNRGNFSRNIKISEYFKLTVFPQATCGGRELYYSREEIEDVNVGFAPQKVT
jgi:hypothetical protein